ncbi:pentapeptide repeat-containing protein [Actinacidiphila acidipaludis]|uniref:Pentapeptide repeat-containing protein n=1 Tax=Actinacidiphila acidipaludis TaxID=2873382 RepID=A0ABS7Q9W9_9ACTN|nr:pentapeptide repeat-containing protein [Streptomyces acidipaludis]MBY8879240.1 pentapeptide repeat-containing protein [Streptomyces acidipaludis]
MSTPAPDLRADCGNCFGLCCVALAFTRSSDFARDKKAGDPCRHLDDGHRCGIHDGLRDAGYRGCTVYDCFGAGQRISQVTFGGQDWRDAPDGGRTMFAALPVMRQLHELLWYLDDTLSRRAAAPTHPAAAAAREHVAGLTALPAAELLALDVAAERAAVNEVLLRAGELVRRAAVRRPRNRRGADLVGARMRGVDLRGADLRGACLIGADLRDADLRSADLIGADLRDTDLRGADLDDALYVAQSQINAARGDGRTRIPAALTRPGHWAR